MTGAAALAFAIGMALLELSPGPGLAAVLSRTLTGGLGAGWAVIAGLCIGDLIFLALAVAGLAALAASFGPFFQLVKYAGAAYLIALGVMTWRGGPPLQAHVACGAQSRWRDVLLGLVVTLGNPKPILFYGAIVPTLGDMRSIGVGDFLMLAAILCAVAVLISGGYALVADRARKWLETPVALRRLARISGGVLVVSGAWILTH